jgi:hypothetical protein
MTRRLNIQQLNNLYTGNSLAVEIPATSEQRRAFVVIGAYRKTGKPGGGRVSKFLNAPHDDMRFWFRKYEIPSDYIENDWDVTDEELYEATFRLDIPVIAELECELEKFLQDFSGLDVSWKRDNPL